MDDMVGRMFLCARCRESVVVCRRCDRGQRYCSPACSTAARQRFQREAGARYQRSDAGRAKHAERSRQWRQRQQRVEPISGEPAPVTHQGSPETRSGLSSALPEAVAGSVLREHRRFTPICPKCASALGPRVRQGFLAPRSRGRRARSQRHQDKLTASQKRLLAAE